MNWYHTGVRDLLILTDVLLQSELFDVPRTHYPLEYYIGIPWLLRRARIYVTGGVGPQPDHTIDRELLSSVSFFDIRLARPIPHLIDLIQRLFEEVWGGDDRSHPMCE